MIFYLSSLHVEGGGGGSRRPVECTVLLKEEGKVKASCKRKLTKLSLNVALCVFQLEGGGGSLDRPRLGHLTSICFRFRYFILNFLP